MRIQLIGFSLVLLSACGVDKPADPLRNASGFCSAWSERVCTDDVADVCGAASKEKCRAAQSGYCLDHVTDDLYTREDAERCLDAATAALRDQQVNPTEYVVLAEFGGACGDLLSGSGTKGTACELDIDCERVNGYACVIPPGSRAGTCQKPHFVNGGEACKPETAVCTEGQYCNGKNCIAKLGAGETCSDDTPCGDEFLCRPTTDTGTYSCVQKIENGARNEQGEDILCASNDECVSHLCDKIAGSKTGRCTKRIVLTVNTALCESMR